MSYYRYHLFFCVNEREDGRPCCGVHGSKAMRDYLKGRVKELGLTGPGGVRVTTAGC
ncbi:MAG: (2Fe-2S) ferredoxin domain-containing protein, partial [Candidatus Thiodiazotropha taylori]|nr:(2Fe-2S) ferredoxin domain-containing protein [Candidatus Thiodiazotropha taylori]MCW4244682.1 (2Fe-2S) ferredoxin domain-containing protein [Candidatus Thiodiazotropha taylori]